MRLNQNIIYCRCLTRALRSAFIQGTVTETSITNTTGIQLQAFTICLTIFSLTWHVKGWNVWWQTAQINSISFFEYSWHFTDKREQQAVNKMNFKSFQKPLFYSRTVFAFVLSSFDVITLYNGTDIWTHATESSDDSSIIFISNTGFMTGTNDRPKLQYDLVFEASVEVFMWQDDGVEYDDLRWDIYITAWWDR